MYNFTQLLSDYNVPHIEIVTNWVNINCPFHENGRRGYKGGFNLIGGYYSCWNCGYHKIEDVFSKLLQLNYYDTKKILNQYDTEYVIHKTFKKKIKTKKIDLIGEDIKEKSAPWKYLIKRRFNPNILIETYKIKYGGVIGEWSHRIVIPIFYNGTIVSYQGRSIYNKKDILRYKTLSKEKSIVNPKSIFYNLDNCKKDWVVLVEGVFDCWRLGPNNVACTLGTSMSSKQLILLKNSFKKVIFLFDNEKEAQDRAIIYGERLIGLGIEVEICNPEFKHDPGSYTIEEENRVRKELCLN